MEEAERRENDLTTGELAWLMLLAGMVIVVAFFGVVYLLAVIGENVDPGPIPLPWAPRW